MDDMEDSGGDQQAISYIRSQWVKRQMKDRSADFTERSRIRVFCGTWNVNGKKCDPAEPLAPWTRAWAAAGDGGPPALAVFGFQEMVDLNAANAVVDTKSAQRCVCVVPFPTARPHSPPLRPARAPAPTSGRKSSKPPSTRARPSTCSWRKTTWWE